MTIENDLTSIEALKDYANKDNCVKSRTYFKIKQDDTSLSPNNCIFQTSNGVWWNVTDITRPVISTKGVDDLSTADGENSFLLTTTYSDTARAFIVDDLNSSQLSSTDKTQLNKTLAFTKLAEATTQTSISPPTKEQLAANMEYWSSAYVCYGQYNGMTVQAWEESDSCDSSCNCNEYLISTKEEVNFENDPYAIYNPDNGTCKDSKNNSFKENSDGLNTCKALGFTCNETISDECHYVSNYNNCLFTMPDGDCVAYEQVEVCTPKTAYNCTK